MRFSRLFPLFAALLPLPLAGSVPAPPSYKGPVRAELLKYLSVRQIHAGSPVFIRVLSDWTGVGCTLRRGAIIEGKVLLANPRSKTRKPSEIALAFNNAQCGGVELAPISFLVAAIAAAPAEDLPVPVIRNMGDPRGVPENSSVSSLSQLSTQMQLLSNQPKAAPPRIPALGEVSGMRGIKLNVGAGPERSSVLSARDKDIALDAHTELILVPTSVAFEAAPPSSQADLLPSDGAPASAASIALAPDLSHSSRSIRQFLHLRTAFVQHRSVRFQAGKVVFPSRPQHPPPQSRIRSAA